jgi:hypothetical protein
VGKRLSAEAGREDLSGNFSLLIFSQLVAGHSKWSKVKRFKGAIDAKRGKILEGLLRARNSFGHFRCVLRKKVFRTNSDTRSA